MMQMELPCCFLSLISRFLRLTLVGKPTACRGRDEVHGATHTCNYSYTLNEAALIVNLVADCILYDANTTALLCPKSHPDSPTFHHHRRADALACRGLDYRTAHICSYQSTLNGAAPMIKVVADRDMNVGDTSSSLCPKSHC